MKVVNGQIIIVAHAEINHEMSDLINTPVYWVYPYKSDGSMPNLDDTQGLVTKYLVIPASFDEHLILKKKGQSASQSSVLRNYWYPVLSYVSKKYAVGNEYRNMAGLNKFQREKAVQMIRQYAIECTWGYVLTIHKSQGSQYPHVGLLMDNQLRRRIKDKNPTDAKQGQQLLYTGATRAEKFLDLLVM